MSNVVMMGAFSPQTFHIALSGDGQNVSRLSDLSSVNRDTFEHEFGHLLHYATSVIGLLEIQCWSRMIDAIGNPPAAATPEEQVSSQAEAILSIARQKQLYTIDDEYYYEPRHELYERARKLRGTWSFRDQVGSLFSSDGSISKHQFWCLRFYLEDGSNTNELSKSFVRIPVGGRCILEHMAMSIDFFSAARDDGVEQAAQQFGLQAAMPEMIHYFALSHYLGPALERRYGAGSQAKAYFVSGQIMSILSEIPYLHDEIWSVVVEYAQRHRPDLCEHMSHPHPSFLFPLLVEAVFVSSADFNNYDFDGLEGRAEEILHHMGLPKLTTLRNFRDNLLAEVCSTLERSQIGEPVARLLRWLRDYSDKLGWKNRVVNPTANLEDLPPVPLLFLGDDMMLGGTEFSFDDVGALVTISHRVSEMLRFPYTRNIVSP